jgi:hypothetical protein
VHHTWLLHACASVLVLAGKHTAQTNKSSLCTPYEVKGLHLVHQAKTPDNEVVKAYVVVVKS